MKSTIAWISVLLITSVGGCGSGDTRPAAASDEQIANLKEKVVGLRRQLEELKYSELRKRTPQEIRALELQVASSDEYYRSVRMRYEAGALSGDDSALGRAGFQLARARAELAWAKQDVAGAVAHRAEAITYATFWREGASDELEEAVITLEAFLDAQDGVLDAQVAFLRAKRIAEAKNVDVDAIQARAAKRIKTELIEASKKRRGKDADSKERPGD